MLLIRHQGGQGNIITCLCLNGIHEIIYNTSWQEQNGLNYYRYICTRHLCYNWAISFMYESNERTVSFVNTWLCETLDLLIHFIFLTKKIV